MTPPPAYDDDPEDDFYDDDETDDSPYRRPRQRKSSGGAYDAFESRGRKRRSRRKAQSNWIGWIIGLTVIFGGLLICGCCGGLFILGSNAIEEEVQAYLQGHPQVEEHIGEIQSLETIYGKSLLGTEDEDEYFYNVVGTKGTCELRLIQHSDIDGFEVIESATMIMPNGANIELDLSDW